MKRNFYFNIALFLCFAVPSACCADTADLSESIKGSLVYLEASGSPYALSQPWKQMPIKKKSGYGCAVGPYEVLTTAENVADATLVQVKRYGRNTYIPATVKIVDYEYNLCLLTLDKEVMDAPLPPLSFVESYPERKQLTSYWLSSSNHLTTARSMLDRAEMRRSVVSFVSVLTFFATNVSRPFGDGQLCCHEKEAVGIAAWGTESDAGIIPAETINMFLRACREDSYRSLAAPGFRIEALLDPAMRKFLQMPEDMKHGAFVSTVYALGTGSEELKQGDVILSINGRQLNAYGRYEHPSYKRISFRHIVQQAAEGENIRFEIFRDGKITSMDIEGRSIASDNMLIPSYSYGKQPEYMVIGGYIFQKLNRDYMEMWGSDLAGKAPPHLYHYQKEFAFMPSAERKDIVILSYVLPAEINLGYQKLSQAVVESVNGTKIKSMKHFAETVNNVGDDEFLKVSFEMDSPVLIIPKKQLKEANSKIAQLYGITKLAHIEK